MRNQVTYIWIGVGLLSVALAFVRFLAPQESKSAISSSTNSSSMRLVDAKIITTKPEDPIPNPTSSSDQPTSAPPPPVPATQAPPAATTAPNPQPQATATSAPAQATATPNPVPLATATTAPAPTRPQGGDTKPNGQTWYPPDSNGRIRVDGPCGNPSCIGYWNPAANGGAGGWDPNFPQPGASTPVPKKPSSSGGAGSNPTPTPKPVALSTLLSATPTLGKACKSATSCVDVKITYESNTGLVVKGSTDTPADLSGVSYIEFTVAAKKYRIIVTGGVPQVDARPQ